MNKIIFITLFGLFFILSCMISIGLINQKLNGTTVDCFDEYGNKMIGQECIKTNGNDYLYQNYIHGLIAFIVINLLGYLISSISSEENYKL